MEIEDLPSLPVEWVHKKVLPWMVEGEEEEIEVVEELMSVQQTTSSSVYAKLTRQR